MRLQNIISKYDNVYIDDIVFNENTYELEIDLWWKDGKKEDFIKECNLIKDELEQLGYTCAYDDEYAERIYELYIII